MGKTWNNNILRKINPRIDRQLRLSVLRGRPHSIVISQKINAQICDAQSTKNIITICNQNLNGLNSCNIATALHRTAQKYEAILNKTANDPLIASKVESKEVFNMLRKPVLYQLKNSLFNPKELSNVAWALATLGIIDREIFEAIGKRTIDSIRNFNEHDLSITAYAFARVGIRDTSLFEEIARESIKKIDSFIDQDLALIVWSFAVMQIDKKRLFETFSAEIMKKLGVVMDEHCLMIAWSYAAIDRMEMINRPEFFEKINAKTKFSDKQLSQLYEILVYIKACRPSLKLLMSESVINAAKTFMRVKSSNKPRPPISQNQLSSALNQVDFNHLNEYFCAGYFMDCANTYERINVEMDGDIYHYASDGQLLGNCILRDRILKAMGWKVIRIKMSKWNELRGMEERKAFLRKLLPK